MFIIKAIKNYFYQPLKVVLVMGLYTSFYNRLDNSGKTTLLHTLNNDISETLARTRQRITHEATVLDNMLLIVVDQARLRWMRAEIDALKIEGIVFMIDLTDKGRFDEAFDALKAQYKNINRPDNIPIAILGSKIDRKDAISLEAVEKIFEHSHQFQNLKVFRCNVSKRIELREPFEWLKAQFQN